MTSITPPDQPNRRIEIVPLPAPGAPSARPFGPRGAWREPSITTATFEALRSAPQPDPTERLWVVSAGPEGPTVAARATAEHDAPEHAQGRLQAMLERERTALLTGLDANDATPPHTPTDPATAPFPLPLTAGRDGRLQRTPKARRANASARPLAADVAAAIARATGHEQPPPPAPSLSLVRRITARERLDIVPLEDPPAAPPETKHRIIDLRERRRLRNRTNVAYLCPTCHRKGIVDLIDNVGGTVRASCPRCVETWTTDLHPDHAPVDPR